jgi:hypothetical protein
MASISTREVSRTGLTPETGCVKTQIGLRKLLQILGTAPYKFKSVQLTALGKSRLKQGL